MNQLCKVCGEPAAGFHFGAFTCEGCKSFFGRTYNNISAIAGCKNNGDCIINKKNRTACKACRLRKCLLVGMSKSGSRYGRRSNWFKIHCLLQEQHTQQSQDGVSAGPIGGGSSSNYEQLARLHHIQARQTYQDKTNPCIKSASLSPTLSLTATGLSQQAAAVVAATTAAAAAAAQQQQHRLPHYLTTAKFLNGIDENRPKSESRLSATPSDSGASSAGDAGDDCQSTASQGRASNEHHGQFGVSTRKDADSVHHTLEQPLPTDSSDSCHKQFVNIFRSHSEPLKIFSPLGNSTTAKSPFAPYAALNNLPPPVLAGTQFPPLNFLPASRLRDIPASIPANLAEEDIKHTPEVQHEPIDLSLKTHATPPRTGICETSAVTEECCLELSNVDVIAKPTPLDLTLVRTQTLTG